MKELEYLAQQVAKGRLSRRDFMSRASAAGMSTVLASTLLGSARAMAEPKRGGFARFGMAHGATTDSLDPGTYPDTFTQCAFSGAMSNTLTEVDADGKISGDLAESFEPSSGAKTWAFKIRRGLTFHNGKTVTAADVVASYRHHMGENSKSAAKSVLAGVTEMKADGPETIVFTLNEANADFPYLCSDYHLVIAPEKDGGCDWQSGVRTGPFVFERFNPGVSAKLKRNPNYHKTGRPYFDEVEFLVLTDVAARTNALTTGEVHCINRCELKTVDLLKRNTNIEVTETQGYAHYALAMNTTVPPFDNVDVRLALKYALDREDVLKKIFLGYATVGNDNPIAPSVRFAIDPTPKHAYDIEKAKFHLKKAGLSSLKVPLSVADAAFNGAVDLAVLYREHASKAGIEVDVIREPNDGYWDKVWLKKPFCATYWGGRATCDAQFSLVYAAGAKWNETAWNNARFNELLIVARGETDDAKRATMYAEMQQLVHDDGGTIVLVFNNVVNANSKKLAHGRISGVLDMDGLRIAERWWMA